MTAVEVEPIPETSALLADPPHYPPTGVGSGTLPPPPDFYPNGHTKVRRFALAFLAMFLAMTAFPIASGGSAGRVATASTLAVTSVDVGLQAATGSMHPWSEVVAPVAWRVIEQAAALPAKFGKRHGRQPLDYSSPSESLVLEPRASGQCRRLPNDHVPPSES